MKADPSKRELENREWLKDIKKAYDDSKGVYGSVKVKKVIDNLDPKLRHYKGGKANHKRIERLMSENQLYSKVKKKYKATTNSKHHLPVAENLLNRNFEAEKSNQKLVSDITYVATEEGFLYVAAINDLCGGLNVGLSMSTRMTKELVLNALDDAYRRGGKPNGAILHSDRGSQYCSYAYQDKLKEYGYICSMSRKGNCWDNAPMESFWGKMKMEWLNEHKFKTIDEAKRMVFEYIIMFHNRQRLHAAYDYMTPLEYYTLKQGTYRAA